MVKSKKMERGCSLLQMHFSLCAHFHFHRFFVQCRSNTCERENTVRPFGFTPGRGLLKPTASEKRSVASKLNLEHHTKELTVKESCNGKRLKSVYIITEFN